MIEATEVHYTEKQQESKPLNRAKIFNFLTGLLGRLEVLVLIAIAIVAFTRPREDFLAWFTLLIGIALTIQFVINWNRRNRAEHWLAVVATTLGINALRSRAHVRVIHLVALMGCLSVSFIGQLMIFYEPPEPQFGYFLMISGVVSFVVLLLRLPYRQHLMDSTSSLVPPTQQCWWRIRRAWLYLALLLTFILTSQSARIDRIGPVFEYLLLWIPALIALAVAFYQPTTVVNNQVDDIILDRDVDREVTLARDIMPRWEVMLIVGLFAVALLVRGINIETLPGPYDGDEANFAEMSAIATSNDLRINPFHNGWDSYSNLHSALISISLKMFGLSNTATRIPAVLIGTLTIVALYLLGRELYGWQTGLLTAMFGIGWGLQIQFSRLTLNQGGDVLFGTLAMYFLLRGLRRRSGFDYALCGIALGIAQMFYLASLHLVAVMIGFLIFLFLFQRRTITRQWRLLWIVPFACIITFFPRLYYLWYNNMPYTYHTEPNIIIKGDLQQEIANGNVQPYLTEQFAATYLALFSRNDTSNWYNYGTNLLSPVGGPPLLIGAVISLLMLRKRPYLLFPLMWGAAAIFLAGTLSIYPPKYQRLYTGASAYALLVGFGLSAVVWGIQQLMAEPKRRRLVLAGVGSAIMVLGLFFYFGVHIRADKYLKTIPAVNSNRTGESMLAAHKAGKQVILVGKFSTGVENTITVKYYMANRYYVDVPEGVTIADSVNGNQIDLTRPIALIVVPDRLAEARQFLELVPNPSGVTVTQVPMIDLPGLSHYLITSPGIVGNEAAYIMTAIPMMTPTPILPPTQVPLALSTPSEPGRCINVIGEATAAGYVRIEVPPSGSWLVHLQPMNHYLRYKLDELGFMDVPILDRTVISGALGPGINEANPDYLRSVVFQQALTDHCKATVIMPWVSDLTFSNATPEQSAVQYADRLTKLLYELMMTNTDANILLVKHYPAEVNEFMKGTDSGVTEDNIAIFNEQLDKICESSNPDWKKVVCIDPMDNFEELDNDYLVSSLTYADIQADLAPDQNMSVADAYMAEHPDAKPFVGDGIRLNMKGKAALAHDLAQRIKDIFVR